MKGEPTEPSTPWPFKRSGDSAADLRAEIDRLEAIRLRCACPRQFFPRLLRLPCGRARAVGIGIAPPTRPFLDYLRGLEVLRRQCHRRLPGHHFPQGALPPRKQRRHLAALQRARTGQRRRNRLHNGFCVEQSGSRLRHAPHAMEHQLRNTVNRNILLFLINAKFANESDDKIMEIGSAAFNPEHRSICNYGAFRHRTGGCRIYRQ